MKERIVFFVLGAVLATIAYFAGCYAGETSKGESANRETNEKIVELEKQRVLRNISL